MKNKLGDLNNYLFEQLERLNDDELIEENMDKEIKRTKSITSVATNIINNAKLALDAQRFIDEVGNDCAVIPNMLQIENNNEK